MMWFARSSLKLAGVLLVLVFILATPVWAALPVPHVHHEFSLQVGPWKIGIAETDRLAQTEFRQIIVPGKMITLYAGPLNSSVPLGLDQSLCVLTLLLILPTSVFVFLRRR